MNEKFEIFKENEFLDIKTYVLVKFIDYCNKNSKIILKEVEDRLIQIFRDLKNTSLSEESEIGYIVINLLRTSLIERDYRYKIFAYSEALYFEEGLELGYFDLTNLYACFNEMWDMALNDSKKYVGKISKEDIRDLMFEHTESFHNIFVVALRGVVTSAVNTEEFLSLGRSEEFVIMTGEFYELCDIIYKENNSKIRGEIIKEINQNKLDSYFFEDYRDLDLSDELDFLEMDLSYTDFTNSLLKYTSFKFCEMVCTKLVNTDLSYCVFLANNFIGAEFERSNLTDSIFNTCVFGIGNPFKNAKLIGTSFNRCTIESVDFTSAITEDIDFTDSVLLRCIFTEEQVSNLVFDQQQLKNLIIKKITNNL